MTFGCLALGGLLFLGPTCLSCSGSGGVFAKAFDNVEYGKSTLSIGPLAQSEDVDAHIRGFLRESGFRMWERRSRWIRDNFDNFIKDGRCLLLEKCAPALIEYRKSKRSLSRKGLLELERNAVEGLARGVNKVNGTGPKQARHFLKQVGLSVYTMPVDSRLMNFLWDVLDAPDEAGPSTAALGDEHTVRMVENWFGSLAELVGMSPVELDTLIWEAYGE